MYLLPVKFVGISKIYSYQPALVSSIPAGLLTALAIHILIFAMRVPIVSLALSETKAQRYKELLEAAKSFLYIQNRT